MRDGTKAIASIAAMRGGRTLTAAAAIVAALALAACGGDDEPEPSIPREDAETLVATLDEVRDNIDVGSCLVATDKVQEFQDELGQLSSDVDDEVRDGLERGAQNLLGLVDEQCEEPAPETTTEEIEPTTTEEPEPTEPTQPTEPTTTEETTTTTPPLQPPGEGGSGQGPGATGGLGTSRGGGQ
jgi:hypothetical protein